MASANKQVICEELMRLAAQDRDVLVLCSDSRGSGSMTDFAKAFPRQFVEVGIAEQDLVGIAATATKVCVKNAESKPKACKAAFWPAAVWSRSR